MPFICSANTVSFLSPKIGLSQVIEIMILFSKLVSDKEANKLIVGSVFTVVSIHLLVGIVVLLTVIQKFAWSTRTNPFY